MFIAARGQGRCWEKYCARSNCGGISVAVSSTARETRAMRLRRATVARTSAKDCAARDYGLLNIQKSVDVPRFVFPRVSALIVEVFVMSSAAVPPLR